MSLLYPNKQQVFAAIEEVAKTTQAATSPPYNHKSPFSIDVGTRATTNFCVHGNRYTRENRTHGPVIFVTLAYATADTDDIESNPENWLHYKYNRLTKEVEKKLKQMGARVCFSGRAKWEKGEPYCWTVQATWPK